MKTLSSVSWVLETNFGFLRCCQMRGLMGREVQSKNHLESCPASCGMTRGFAVPCMVFLVPLM